MLFKNSFILIKYFILSTRKFYFLEIEINIGVLVNLEVKL